MRVKARRARNQKMEKGMAKVKITRNQILNKLMVTTMIGKIVQRTHVTEIKTTSKT